MASPKEPMFFKRKSVTLSGRASDLQSQDCFFSVRILVYSCSIILPNTIFIAGLFNEWKVFNRFHCSKV